MTAYENDVLIIPKKYKKMSVSELKKEEQKLTFIFKADFKSKGTGFVRCLVFFGTFCHFPEGNCHFTSDLHCPYNETLRNFNRGG